MDGARAWTARTEQQLRLKRRKETGHHFQPAAARLPEVQRLGQSVRPRHSFPLAAKTDSVLSVENGRTGRGRGRRKFSLCRGRSDPEPEMRFSILCVASSAAADVAAFVGRPRHIRQHHHCLRECCECVCGGRRGEERGLERQKREGGGVHISPGLRRCLVIGFVVLVDGGVAGGTQV